VTGEDFLNLPQVPWPCWSWGTTASEEKVVALLLFLFLLLWWWWR
jgi:hypothetical protein